MPQLKIYGRTYEVPENFTLGELREIKRISGINAGQMGDALNDGDPDVLAALVYVTLKRNGEKVTLEELDKVEMSDILFEADEEEVKADPPADAAETAATNGHSATTLSGSGTQPTVAST